jgi:hypothetical protein
MATWKLTPNWKKSLVEKNYYTNGDKTIVHELGWRWGEFFIYTDNDTSPELPESGEHFDIFSLPYTVDDWSTDDGCWEENELDGFTEEDEKAMLEWLNENSVIDLDGLDGWTNDEFEMWMTCEYTLEKVEE